MRSSVWRIPVSSSCSRSIRSTRWRTHSIAAMLLTISNVSVTRDVVTGRHAVAPLRQRLPAELGDEGELAAGVGDEDPRCGPPPQEPLGGSIRGTEHRRSVRSHRRSTRPGGSPGSTRPSGVRRTRGRRRRPATCAPRRLPSAPFPAPRLSSSRPQGATPPRATSRASTATTPSSVTTSGLRSADSSHDPACSPQLADGLDRGDQRRGRPPSLPPQPARTSPHRRPSSTSRAGGAGRERQQARPRRRRRPRRARRPRRTAAPARGRCCPACPTNASPMPATIDCTATVAGAPCSRAIARSSCTTDGSSSGDMPTRTASSSVRWGTSASFTTRRSPRLAIAGSSSTSGARTTNGATPMPGIGEHLHRAVERHDRARGCVEEGRCRALQLRTW